MSDEQDRINQHEWDDAANWRWSVIYRSERDTRTLVPRPDLGPGWTLNFAHRTAWLYLLGLSIVPLGFLLLFVLVRS